MCPSELAVIDSSVFVGSQGVQIGMVVCMRLVHADQAHWMGNTMPNPLAGVGWEGSSGSGTVPDLGQILASLLSLWTRGTKMSSSQLRMGHQKGGASARKDKVSHDDDAGDVHSAMRLNPSWNSAMVSFPPRPWACG